MSMGAGRTTREVVIEIAAQADNFLKNTGLMGDAVKEVAFALTGFEEKAFNALNRVGRKMLMTSAAIQASNTANLYVAAQWERQFTQVEKTIDGSRQQINALERDLRRISTRTPVSAGELAGIASVAGQLGIAVESVEEFTEVAAELGVATDLSSTQAIVSLSRIIKVMGESEDTVRNLGNSLVYLGNTSNTTESQILNFAQNIAGTAGVVGLASDEVLGIATAFSSAGIEAEAGGTAVQKVLLAINEAVTVGGPKLQQFSAILGMSQEQFQSIAKVDPARIFSDFVSALSTAGPEASLILRQLGLTDQRLTRAFLNVASSSEGVAGAIARSRREYAEGNALGDEAAKQFDTFIESSKQLRNVMAEIGRSMGEVFVKPATEFIQALTKLLNLINAIPQPVMNFAAAVASLAGGILAITGTTAVFARFIGMFEGFVQLLRTKVVSESVGALLRGGGAGFFGSGGGRVGGFFGDLFSGRSAKKFSELDGWTQKIARGAGKIGEAFGGASRGLFDFLRMSEEQREAARGSVLGRARLAAGRPFRAIGDAGRGAFAAIRSRASSVMPSAATGAAAAVVQQQEQVIRQTTDRAKKGMDTMAMYAAQGSEKASAAVKKGQKEIDGALESTSKRSTSAARAIAGFQIAAVKAFMAYAAIKTVVNLADAAFTKSLANVENYTKALERLAETTGTSYDPSRGSFDPGAARESREDYLRRFEAENADLLSILLGAREVGFSGGDITDTIDQQDLSERLMNLKMRLEYGGVTGDRAVELLRDAVEVAFSEPIDIAFSTKRGAIDFAVEQVAEEQRTSGLGRGLGRMFGVLASPFSDYSATDRQIGSDTVGELANAAEFALQANQQGDRATFAYTLRQITDTFGAESAEVAKFNEFILGLDDRVTSRGFSPIGSADDLMGGRGVSTLVRSMQENGRFPANYEGLTPTVLADYLRRTGGDSARELADVIDPLVTSQDRLLDYLENGMPSRAVINPIDDRTDFQRGLEDFAPGFQTQGQREQRQLLDQYIKQQEALHGQLSTLQLIQGEMATMTSETDRASERFNILASAAERLRDAIIQGANQTYSVYVNNNLEDVISRARFLNNELDRIRGFAPPEVTGNLQSMITQQGFAAGQQLRARYGSSRSGGGGNRYATEDHYRGVEKRRKDHLERLEEMQEAYNERMESAISSAFSTYDATQRAFSGRSESITDIIWNFEDQNKKLREFNAGIQRFRQMLTAAGADEQLQDMIVENLGLDDPRNFAQLDRILKDVDRMGVDLIDSLVGQARTRQQVVTTTAKETTDEITEDYEEQKSKAIEAYEEAAAAAERSYKRSQEASGRAASTAVSNQELIKWALNSTDPEIQEWGRLFETALEESQKDVEGLTDKFLGLRDAVTEVSQGMAAWGDRYATMVAQMSGTNDFFSKFGSNLDPVNGPFGTGSTGQQQPDSTQAKTLIEQYQSLYTSPEQKASIRSWFSRYGMSMQQAIGRYGDTSGTDTSYLYGLHEGGIASGPTRAMLGEGGFREAVIPLNQRGVSFLQTLASTMAVRTPTGGYGGGGGSTTTTMSERHEYGPITVMADDPNQMRKKLEQRRRLQRLTQPARSGIGGVG